MSLDNSSCNLASLNLMKFLRDDDTFDAPLFAKAVELIITAMDISICFADFPTESIGADHARLPPARHRLRQPRRAAHGDGARLRLRRRPGDGGGDHVSLMTGTSYKRSAELAGVVGPYAGYARNADARTSG